MTPRWSLDFLGVSTRMVRRVAAKDCNHGRKGLLPSVARERSPLLGKGGVDATSKKCREATSDGAGGVVRSTTDNWWF